jgi:glucose/arabinose dehydrogenase
MSGRNRLWVVAFGLFAVLIAVTVTVHTPRRVRSDREPTRPAGAEPTLEDVPLGSGKDVRPRMTKVAQLGTTVTAFATVPDGTEMLVGERTGFVWALRRHKSGRFTVPTLSEAPVLDLSKEVSLQGEQGFFGLAFVGNGSRVVVTYSALDGTLIVDSYAYAAGAPIDTSTRVRLLSVSSHLPFHYGGGLAVGPHGDLFVSVGDLATSLPVVPAPQDPALINGGVVRIPADVVSAATTSWVAAPGDQVARGLRNPWRISVDPPTGDLWIGNVGNETIESVDRVAGSKLGGRTENFGWPYYEGSVRHYRTLPPDLRLDPSALERRQKGDVCGMVGGFVYRGDLLPALSGRYLYGDLCNRHVRSFRVGRDGSATDDSAAFDLTENIVSFGEGPTGEVYGLGTAGGVYRVDPGWWSVRDLDQERTPATTTTTVAPESAAPIDCKVIDVLKPLTYLGALSPDELEQATEGLVSTLDATIPDLPPDVADAARTVRRAFAALAAELAPVGWDLTSPSLLGVRDEMLNFSGDFTGLGDAMGTLYGSRCK